MLILHNARIHTLDEQNPFAQAIAVELGKVKYVGTNEQILASSSRYDKKIDLSDKCVLPGLIDSHIHLDDYALSLNRIDCETDTIEACIAKVADNARKMPVGEWIMGHGWDQNKWDGKFGHRSDLDSVAPENPVYLTAKSLHMGWANSAALKLAGVDVGSSDPNGGRIQRDEFSNPTGIFFDTAMQLVENIIPPIAEERLHAAIINAQIKLIKMGLTGIHDFGRAGCFSILNRIHQDGELKLRVCKNFLYDYLDNAIATGFYSGFGDDHLRIGSLKLFSDGALGSQTAAMFTAYDNDPSNCGILLIDKAQIIEYALDAIKKGFSLAIHAIGDLANHEVMEAFQQIRKIEKCENISHLRHRVEHVQIIEPNDIKLMVNNNIIASVQPIHATSDMLIANQYWGERCVNAYAYKNLIRKGAILTMGSDAPVESPNPFLGIHAAVTRCRRNSYKSWYPRQRLSFKQALTGFTYNPAYVMGMEDRLGRIKQNYYADLIVLSVDPLTVSPYDIGNLSPEAVMINGEWAWKSS